MAVRPPEESVTIPTTGMRGGLGRTLLTAFLIMTIGPLAVLSWYAARSGRRNIERQVMAKLSTVATVTEARILEWTYARSGALDLFISGPDVQRDCETLIQAEAVIIYTRDILPGLL